MNKFTYEPFRMPEPKFGKIYDNSVLSQSGEVATKKMENTSLVSYFDSNSILAISPTFQ